jgi:DNA-binding NarL/FixJ family response regulator
VSRDKKLLYLRSKYRLDKILLTRVKVLVVDDHTLVREGLSALLLRFEIDVIGGASNGMEMLDFLSSDQPDVILLDVQMPLMNGFEAIKIINRNFKAIAVIMLTQYDAVDLRNQFLNAGAIAVFNKSDPIAIIVKAIKNYKNFNRALNSLDKNIFTSREIEVIQLLSGGFSNIEIAQYLSISEKTVSSHREHLYRKTDSHNATHFLKYMIKNGLDQLNGFESKE